MSLKVLWSRYNQKVDKIDCAREYKKSGNTFFYTESSHIHKNLDMSLRAQSILSTPLPTACPIVTNIFSPYVMRRCRVEESLLRDLISDGILFLDSRCPFSRSCGLICVIEDNPARGSRHNAAITRAVNTATMSTAPTHSGDTDLVVTPGDCERCPGSGEWDHAGPGRWCFHRAYFLGKSGQPVHCDDARDRCPLT